MLHSQQKGNTFYFCRGRRRISGREPPCDQTGCVCLQRSLSHRWIANASLCGSLSVCVCLSIYVQVHICVSMCEGQRSNSGVFQSSPTIHSVSRWPGTCKQTRLTGERVPDLPASSTPQNWNFKCMSPCLVLHMGPGY